MSNRALRKLYLKDELKQQASRSKEEEESEEEDSQASLPAKAVANAFDLLSMDEGETNNDEEEAEEQQEETKPAKPSQQQQQQQSKKKKKKKQKKQQNKVDSQAEQGKAKGKAQPQDEEEDIDQIIQQYGVPSSQRASGDDNSQSETNKNNKRSVFAVDPKYLSAEAELLRLFGKQTIKEARKSEGTQQQQQGTAQLVLPPRGRRGGVGGGGRSRRLSSLVKVRDNWPLVPSPATEYGFTMEFVSSKKGVNYFRMVWSDKYRKLQDQFYQCVQTHNPYSFQGVLQLHPYHIDSLLQLSEVCKQTGEFQTAMDFLERCLYAFETSWHHLFRPFAPEANTRLLYQIEENRPFFLSLFRYIQMLGREGSSRTALEYCKLLYNLDPSDPLGVLFIMDHYAVRSQQYKYLLDVFASFTAKEQQQQQQQQHQQQQQQQKQQQPQPEEELVHLEMLPNWRFSLALAKHYMERQQSPTANNSSSTNTINSSNNNNNNTNESREDDILNSLLNCSSDELLQNALMMFPMVLGVLCKKSSVSLQHFDSSIGSNTDLSQHAFFADTTCPSALQHLVTLYTEKNFTLWKDPQVGQWLKKNVLNVIEKAEANHDMVANLTTAVREHYETSTSGGLPLYHHLLLSEHSDSISSNALPPEIVTALRQGGEGGGVHLYDAFEEMQHPVIHATTANPFALFWNTLVNPVVPNAPPVQQQQQQQQQHQQQIGGAWLQDVLTYLNQLGAGQEDDDGDDVDD